MTTGNVDHPTSVALLGASPPKGSNESSLLDRVASSASDNDLDDFFENGSVALHLVNADGIILRANRAELELLGYAREEYVGRPIADFHADPEVIADILRRLLAGERLDRYPARLRARDGSLRYVEISSSARADSGEFKNTRCFTVDVTKTQEAQAARLSAERRLLTTYESVTVGIGETDGSGKFTRVNAAFEAMTGYSRDELLDMSFEQLTHSDDRAEDLARYQEQVAGARSEYSLSKRYVRKDGGVIHVEVSSSSATGPDGRFEYGVRVVKDVTDRVLAEEALRDSERQSRALLEALPMAVYTTDRHGKITYFNEAAATLAGRRPKIGVDEWCVTWKLYWPDGRPLPHDQCPMAMAIKAGDELRGIEAIAERPDGARLAFMPFPTLLRDGQGEVVGAVNVLVDITERKRADDAQATLIDELNHRVKNTLATGQSIAQQTWRATPEAFVERFEARLMALSRSHDLLTRRRWTGVGMGELLDATFAPYIEEPELRVLLRGPELTLSSRTALAFGMALHELAGNAAKHGALSAPDGRLQVDWQVIQADELPVLDFRWIEQHGPAVEPPPRTGVGLRLIHRNIGKDLAGSVEVRFPSSGAEVHLRFPLA